VINAAHRPQGRRFEALVVQRAAQGTIEFDMPHVLEATAPGKMVGDDGIEPPTCPV
jgi:hypothetical protein